MGTSRKPLEDRIIDWVIAQPAIRTAIIGGSTERRVNPADRWADLDFELYVTDYSEFVPGTVWLSQFGSLWTVLQLQENGAPIALALYEGGQKVDFHFFHVDKLHHLIATQTLPDSCRRGYRIVVDKDDRASKLAPPSYEPPDYQKPTENAFTFEVDAFWYGVVYVAKQIRRRNLWVVKTADWRIKQNLLKVLEWHAQSTHPNKIDTWHDGHFISQWVDKGTRTAFEGLFGTYEARSSWQALFATADIFHNVGAETAHCLGYKYPMDLEIQVTQFVKSLYDADDLLLIESKQEYP